MRGFVSQSGMIRAWLFAFLALVMAPVAVAAPPVSPAPLVHIALTTTQGVITLELDRAHAPITVSNFLRYVDQKRFDGIVFYRAMRLDWGTPPNGLVQAGTRGDYRRVLKPIAHEPTNMTGILHKAGTDTSQGGGINLARGGF